MSIAFLVSATVPLIILIIPTPIQSGRMNSLVSTSSVQIDNVAQSLAAPTLVISNDNRSLMYNALQNALKRVQSRLNVEEISMASGGIEDAYHVIRSINLQKAPKVEVNTEGLVTLQWQRQDRGILLVFHGDKSFTCSTKEPGMYYIDSYEEFSILRDTSLIKSRVSAIINF